MGGNRARGSTTIPIQVIRSLISCKAHVGTGRLRPVRGARLRSPGELELVPGRGVRDYVISLPPLTSVNFPAVTDAEDQHYRAVVLQRANEAVVSDPVFPKLAECALELSSNGSRIIQFFDGLVEKSKNSAGDGLVELIQLLERCWRNLNLPCHSAALLFQAGWACSAPSEHLPMPSPPGRCLPDHPDIGG